jgi:hypothetical protein
VMANHNSRKGKALRQAWDALVADLGEPASAVVRRLARAPQLPRSKGKSPDFGDFHTGNYP